jgi:threonine dehydratase
LRVSISTSKRKRRSKVNLIEENHQIMKTPLRKLPHLAGIENLFVKDESVHPTGTFKDRLTNAALQRYPPGTTFGAISYGNTAISFALAIREAGAANSQYRFVAFVPQDLPKWELGPSSQGAHLSGAQILEFLSIYATVVPIDLSRKIFDEEDLLERARASDSTVRDLVNVTEGLDEPAYVGIIREAVEQLGFVPDYCLIPFGAGILCNEIIDFLGPENADSVIPLSVPNRDSLARMLYGPIWVDTERLRRNGVALSRHCPTDHPETMRKPYLVRAVSEEQVMRGLARAEKTGLSAEPSGSVGLGVLDMLPNWVEGFDPKQDSVLVVNTGNAIDAFDFRTEDSEE